MGIKIKFASSAGRKKKEQPTTAFKTWYDNHKTEYNAERRRKYYENAEYRKRMLDSATKSRKNKKPRSTRPEEYSLSLSETAAMLDVTIWTLRNWKENRYYPEPSRFNGEVWFTQHQFQLLSKIKYFLNKNGITRLDAAERAELRKIAAVIHEEWR